MFIHEGIIKRMLEASIYVREERDKSIQEFAEDLLEEQIQTFFAFKQGVKQEMSRDKTTELYPEFQKYLQKCASVLDQACQAYHISNETPACFKLAMLYYQLLTDEKAVPP